MRTFFFPFLLSIIFLILQVFVDVKYSFVSDPLVKAIQIESLKINHYSSEEFFYPAKDLDPKAEFQPMPRGFVFYLNQKIYSVFPIGFAFLYAYIPVGIQFLPYTNFILIFLLLFALKKFLNFHNISLAILLFGTVVFPISFDFSENPIFLLLIGIGFIFFVKFLETDNKKFFIYSSSFIAFSVWFRLEGLIFYGCLFFSLLVFVFSKRLNLKLMEISYGNFIFLILFLVFALFNYFHYGAALGTRYLINFQDELDLSEKLLIFTDIVFTRIEKGIPKFGFFFYSPIFLFMLLLVTRKWKELIITHKVMVVFSILLILGIGLGAPNNGISITGRYLSALTFPLLYLLNENWSLVFDSKLKKIFSYSLLAWTFLISFVSLSILKFSFKSLKEYQTYFQTVDTDFWVFTSRASSGFVGFEYLKKKILALESKTDIRKFYRILSEHKIHKFSVFFLNENFVNQAEIFQYKREIMLSELASLKYGCTEKETFQQVTRFDCSKLQ